MENPFPSILRLWLLTLVGGIFLISNLIAQTVAMGPFDKRDIEIPDSGDVRVVAYPPHAEGYLWSNGWKTPVIFVKRAGWYWVDVTVNNFMTRDSMFFHHAPSCFNIPNAFSPNSEAFNDCIDLRTQCEIDSLRFMVFDRWGIVQYETTNPEDCWYGNSEDHPLPDGVYYYMLRWYKNGGLQRRRVGNITIIR
jgi:gliding motility-associated-like protein